MKQSGSITVFLSLILVSVLTFVCVVLESARVSAVASRGENITYMALDSCFAGYARELFEEYGVMALWNKENQFVSNFERFAGVNCKVTNGLTVKNKNIMGLELESVNIASCNYITDMDGEIFADQVCQYMKYEIPTEMLNELKGKSEGLNQGEKTQQCYDKMSDCEASFQDMETDVSNMRKDIDLILGEEKSPEDIVKSVKDNPDMNYGNYKQWMVCVIGILNSVSERSDLFYIHSEKVSGKVNELNNKLEAEKNSLSQDVYDALNSEVNEMSKRLPENSNDFYNVNANNANITAIKIKLEQISQKVDEYYYSSNRDDKVIDGAIEIARGLNLEILNVNMQQATGEKKENIFVNQVNSMFQNGILALIVSDTNNISQKKIEAVNIPSDKECLKGKNWKHRGTINESTRKVLMSEYALRKFGNYLTQSSETGLQYEAEYMVAGKRSDKENLVSVAEKIIVVRTGFNIVSILKDNEKREETYLAAFSIAGATGMPMVVRMVQFGIIGAWASAESVADVRNLLNNKKVALIKNADQWNLSLANIIGITMVNKENDDVGGLGYEDYLRFFMYSVNKAVLSYRIMDMIDINLREKYNKDICLNDCISSVSIKAKYSVKPLFSGIKFVRNSLSSSPGFELNINQQYSY